MEQKDKRDAGKAGEGYESLSEILLAEHKGLGKLLSSVLAWYIDLLSQKLHEAGFVDLRPVHLRFFRELGLGGVTISTVAARAGITKQAASQMVKELTRLGYVKTMIDPQNLRTRTVSLTDKGSALIIATRHIIAEVQEMMIAELGRDDFESMVAGLLKLRNSAILKDETKRA